MLAPDHIRDLHEIFQRDKKNKDGIEESEPNTRLQQPPSANNLRTISCLTTHVTNPSYRTTQHRIHPSGSPHSYRRHNGTEPALNYAC